MKLRNPLNLLRQAIKFYDRDGNLELFDAVTKMADPRGTAIPRGLFQLGMKLHLRDVINTLAVQSNREWVWPYWIERQFDPRCSSFIPRSHALAQINLTHRNWTILGLPGDFHRAIVDPRSLVTPWHDGWSLDFWLRIGQELYTPGRAKKARQDVVGGFPEIKTRLAAGKLSVRSRVLAALVEGEPLAVVRVRLVNDDDQPVSARFYYAIRPYNPEGISLVHNLEFVDNRILMVNQRLGMVLAQPPRRVHCSTLKKGAIASSSIRSTRP